jgi:hypothetical protein
LIFGAFLIAFITLSFFRKFISIHKKIVHKKIKELKDYYKKEKVFFCFDFDDLGGGLIQLYGESFNTPLRPGMKIIINGVEFVIKEVYSHDETPDKPDPEAPPEIFDTPIVIERGEIDWNAFKQDLKKELVVPLKLL